MECPVCHVAMEQKPFGQNKDVVLDSCAKCGGTWLDEGELNRLDECEWSDIEKETPFRPAESEDREIRCPRCHGEFEALVPEDRPEIVVDRCTGCRGFWLDADEMMKWLLSRVI